MATPGRLADHLENTKGFNLNELKFLGEFIFGDFNKYEKNLKILLFLILQITRKTKNWY